MVVNIETKQKLKEYLTLNGISQSDVANAIGKSPATISLYLRGQYDKGRLDELDKDIESFLAVQEEKIQTKTNVNFSQISATKQIFALLSGCHARSEIGIVFGKAGYGKTTAVKAYAESRHAVILIESGINYTAKDVLVDISEALGLESIGHTAALFRDCLKKLKDSGRLIIIDEAEYLNLTALETLRRLYDMSGNSIGLVLVGMPRLLNNIVGKKKQLEQLYSRRDRVAEINVMNLADTEEILRNNCPIAVQYSNLLLKLSEGRVRSLVKIINETTRLIRGSNRDINEKLIVEAAQGLSVFRD